MKRKTVFVILLAAAIIQISLFAGAAKADDVLKRSSTKVTVDGVISTGEYTYTYVMEGLKLFLTRTDTTLHAAVTADTTGWVGIGFRSDKMDKAEILIGYVKDGKGNLSKQHGSEHGHSDTKIPYVRSYALTESSNSTSLEVELVSKSLISAGQKSLLLIIAYGGDDTLTSLHKARAGVEVKLGD